MLPCYDDLFLCIIQDALPPSSSHHQDYYMFSGGCLVATAAGWVRTQRYSYGFVGGPSLLMILMIICMMMIDHIVVIIPLRLLV